MPPGAAEVDIAGEEIGFEAFIMPPGVLVVAPETAARLEGSETPPLRISDALPPGTALTDIGIAQGLLGAEGRLSRLILWPEQLPTARPLGEVTAELIEKPPVVESDLSRLTDSFHLNLTAFGFLAFAVGASLPLLPFFVRGLTHPLWWTIGLTAVALAGIGLALSLFTGRGAWQGALRMLLIGGGAGVVSFIVGRLLGVALA
jgi:putative ABC transport system permease protein